MKWGVNIWWFNSYVSSIQMLKRSWPILHYEASLTNWLLRVYLTTAYWTLFKGSRNAYIIQICNASVGILMECLPEGGWFSRGRSPRENHPPEGGHSIRIPTLAWHICFIIPNKPQFGKISMKTTMTTGRSSENGGRFAGGHFASGHDGMANLCKPITAYD